MIPRSISDCFNRLGTELDDLTLAFGTNGTITQARAVRAIDRAAVQETLAFWEEGVSPLLWKYEASLTATTGDTDRYELPPRTRAIINVLDTDREYRPLDTMQTQGYGFVVEEGGRAIRLRNISAISGTLKAWVAQEPVRMLAAAVSTAKVTTTSLIFDAIPSVGTAVVQDDYYVGAQVAVMSGTGVGQIRTITDYTGSTATATVSAWTTRPTQAGSSKYSTLLDVPDAAIDAVILRAALICARTDQTMRDYLPDIRDAYNKAHQHAIEVMDSVAITLVHRPLFVHSMQYDDTGEYT